MIVDWSEAARRLRRIAQAAARVGKVRIGRASRRLPPPAHDAGPYRQPSVPATVTARVIYGFICTGCGQPMAAGLYAKEEGTCVTCGKRHQVLYEAPH